MKNFSKAVIIILSFFTISSAFTILGNDDIAVYYGGSASVTLENNGDDFGSHLKGERRVVSATVDCEYSDISTTKKKLNEKLTKQQSNVEKRVSDVRYDIDECKK